MSMDPSNPGVLQKVMGSIKGFFNRPDAPIPSEADVASSLKAFGFGYRDDAVTYVEKEYQRRLTEQRPFHLETRLNIAYLQSDQFLTQDSNASDLIERPKEFWWQTRKVYNQMAPIYEVRVSKLTRGRVVLKARPASTEQRDISAAKVTTRVLASSDHTQNIQRKFSELVTWMEAGGTGITKETWDPNAGKIQGYLSEQKPGDELPKDDGATASQSEPVVTQKPIRPGDANTIICSPFTVFPDSPWHSSVEECGSILEARAYRVEDIYDLWGVTVSAEEVTSLGLQQTNLAGISGNGYRFGTARLQGHAVVKEFWERPSARYTEGRYIVVCNRKLLHIGPLPYKCGKDGQPDLPYTFWWSLRRPGCMWGNTVQSRLRPIQDRYNELRNMKADYIRRVAIGQVVVVQGSVDMDDVAENSGSPGYIWQVEQNATRMPEPVSWPSLPSSFEMEEQTLLGEFTILSGVSDISKTSVAPSGVKSGVALSLALEQDDTRLAQTIANIEWASVDAGQKRIRLYKQFANEARLSKIVGKDGDVDTFMWTGSDLTADDLYVDPTSALGESPAQRKQTVFDLINSHVYDDPATGRLSKDGQRKVLEMLQLGNWEDGTDTDALQMAKQDRENRRLLGGEGVPTSDIDDDSIHLARLVRLMLSSDYDEAIAQNPAVQQAFEAHRQEHMAKIQQQAMQQMQAQMAAQMGAGQQADVQQAPT